MWDLDEAIPSSFPDDSVLVGYNDGNTIIDGDTYDVCDIAAAAGTAKLKQRDGALEYGLVKKEVYSKTTKYIISYTGDGNGASIL